MITDVFFFIKIKHKKEKIVVYLKKICFAKCVKFLTGTGVYSDQIEYKYSFDRKKGVMCQAKNPGFCIELNLDVG